MTKLNLQLLEKGLDVKSEHGSALVSVLSIIAILTVLIGIILSAETVQRRFIHRDVSRLQALYEAEAGVYQAMQMLRGNPYWEVKDTVLTPFEGATSTVSVEAVGGTYLVRSTVLEKQQEVTVLASIAEYPPATFEKAVFMWDATSRLNVAGTTVINGDIEVGQRGIRQNTLAGIRYTGELNGVSSYNPNIQPPFFDDRFLHRSIARLDSIISWSLRGNIPLQASNLYAASLRLPSEFPVYFVDGDVQISPADSALFKTPHSIVASGDMELIGPFSFAVGTQFIAGRRLMMQGHISGERGLFYGRQALLVEGMTQSKGQFFSQQEIIVRDSAYVKYPSLLFLNGLSEESTAKIEVAGHSRVEGNLIHGWLPEKTRQSKGRIVVGDSALVIGGIYNPYETEIHGSVYGSIVTHRFFFYRSPTRYINWMLDALVDARLRPKEFSVPLMFNPNPNLKVVAWHVSRKIVAPASEKEEAPA